MKITDLLPLKMDKLTLKEEKFDHDLQSPVDQVFCYFFYIKFFFKKKCSTGEV